MTRPSADGPAVADVAGWRQSTVEGLSILTCQALSAVPGVGHAFSTRRSAAPGDFDLGGAGSDSEPFRSRRRALVRAAGLGNREVVVLRQVHGGRVVAAVEAARSRPPLDADAAVTRLEDGGGLVPSVRWADCVPVLLSAAGGGAIAAVHAGWRGTAAGIAARTVEALARLGIDPRDLVAAVGPAIGGCCYEVGEDEVEAVARATGVSGGALCRAGGTGRPRLDLKLANRLQLERAGMAPGSIHTAPWCTACDADLFFSYRREGGGGGRQMACIGWRLAVP